MQVDGDLWEQAWKAVLKRGWQNQTLRKVKGHATEDDIVKGISNREDKKGNDLSDELADKGVEAIAGMGLVKLGKWLEARQKKYKKLMNRVHKMIVAVTIAEKEERKKIQTAKKTLLGYDTQKWTEADALIRDESQLEVSYRKIDLVSATKGNHRFTKWQKQYEDVHSFLGRRLWAPVQAETEISGITWIELFALFDTSGTRSADAMHQKNHAAAARAAKRKEVHNQAKGKNKRAQRSTAEAKPTLDEELKLFKAMVRHITKFETRTNGKWFLVDARPRLGRL